jgi:hypothetical protein
VRAGMYSDFSVGSVDGHDVALMLQRTSNGLLIG